LQKNLAEQELFRIFAPNIKMTLMKKRLLIYSFAMLLMLGVPMTVQAVPVAPGIEQLAEDEATINVNDQTVIVSGGQGQTLEVVSLTGRKVMTVKIDSPAQKIELNIPKGCYILKVGKVVRKITVR